MMEITSRKKTDNPIRQGWIERIRNNYYQTTPSGVVAAERLDSRPDQVSPTQRSPQAIYDSVARPAFHPVFRKYLLDPSEPNTWLGAQAFLGLSRGDNLELEDRLRAIKNAADQAIDWMDSTQTQIMRSGSNGGGKIIHRLQLEKLLGFIDTLVSRFNEQMEAIRRRG